MEFYFTFRIFSPMGMEWKHIPYTLTLALYVFVRKIFPGKKDLTPGVFVIFHL